MDMLKKVWKSKKVDSPYRLIKGVTLVTDLRLTTTTLNAVDQAMYSGQNGDILGNKVTSFQNNEIPPFWRQRNILGQYRTIFPALVVDGLLTNDNSQRSNPVSFPAFDLNGKMDFKSRIVFCFDHN